MGSVAYPPLTRSQPLQYTPTRDKPCPHSGSIVALTISLHLSELNAQLFAFNLLLSTFTKTIPRSTLSTQYLRSTIYSMCNIHSFPLKFSSPYPPCFAIEFFVVFFCTFCIFLHIVHPFYYPPQHPTVQNIFIIFLHTSIFNSLPINIIFIKYSEHLKLCYQIFSPISAPAVGRLVPFAFHNDLVLAGIASDENANISRFNNPHATFSLVDSSVVSTRSSCGINVVRADGRSSIPAPRFVRLRAVKPFLASVLCVIRHGQNKIRLPLFISYNLYPLDPLVVISLIFIVKQYSHPWYLTFNLLHSNFYILYLIQPNQLSKVSWVSKQVPSRTSLDPTPVAVICTSASARSQSPDHRLSCSYQRLFETTLATFPPRLFSCHLLDIDITGPGVSLSAILPTLTLNYALPSTCVYVNSFTLNYV